MSQVALRDAQATQAELATVKRELSSAQAQLTRLQAEYETAAVGWRVKDQARSTIHPALCGAAVHYNQHAPLHMSAGRRKDR
jgi:hypothetical protein